MTCGCRVEAVIEHREERSGTSAAGWPAPVAYVPQVLGHRIVYCPLHAVAPALLEALKAQVAWADAGLPPCAPDESIFPRARAAIAAAEARA